jgi:hypothetical protein
LSFYIWQPASFLARIGSDSLSKGGSLTRRVLIILAVIVILLASCGFPIRYTEVRGSGNLITESRRVSGFKAIELNGIGNVVIRQGDKESLEVTADDNLLKYIRTSVNGGTLKIEIQEGVELYPSDQVNYMLTIQSLNSIEINGVGQVEVDKLATGNIKITVNGDGRLDFKEVTADVMTIEINGLSEIDAAGEVHSLQIDLNGSGEIQASDLHSRMGAWDISGSGSITAWVTDVLSFDISGSGDLGYYGSPVIHADISGSGNATALGPK